MRTIAILPMKSYGAAKQRLAGTLGAGARQALAQAMFSDVLTALSHVRSLDAVAVVTADPAAKSTALDDGARVLDDTEQAGQSHAALIGIRHALDTGFDRVLLVPGDTPLLDPAEVADLLDHTPAVAIVPDRHLTGTNALVLTPPDAIGPSFGPGSLARHVAAARAAGVDYSVERVPTLELDVDTPEDLAEVTAALDRARGRAPATRAALRERALEGAVLDRGQYVPPRCKARGGCSAR